jgi:hypothetical protein
MKRLIIGGLIAYAVIAGVLWYRARPTNDRAADYFGHRDGFAEYQHYIGLWQLAGVILLAVLVLAVLAAVTAVLIRRRKRAGTL